MANHFSSLFSSPLTGNPCTTRAPPSPSNLQGRSPDRKASEKMELSEDRALPVRARGVGASEDRPHVLPHGPPQIIAPTQAPVNVHRKEKGGTT